MKNIPIENRELNLGIEILRFLFSLWIVVLHCSIIRKEHKKYFNKGFHVPTFILLSFYFFYQILCKRDINKVVSRFQRLLIPYILWPLIILLLNNILLSIFSFAQFKTKITFRAFYIQIVMASTYHVIFWFQFNLIFLTLFFSIISFIFKQNLLDIFLILGIISFFLIESQINYKIFFHFYGSFGKNIGSIIELLPLAVIGCIYNSIKILSKIEYKSKFFNLLLSFLLFMLVKYNIFAYPKGLRYPHILFHIFASTILFLLFGTAKFKNKNIILIIRNITKFTGGIYYTHTIFRDYLSKIFIFFNKKSYLSSIVLYIICYIFCFIGNKYFKSNKIKYLFN